jgi:hypothetical protein
VRSVGSMVQTGFGQVCVGLTKIGAETKGQGYGYRQRMRCGVSRNEIGRRSGLDSYLAR